TADVAADGARWIAGNAGPGPVSAARFGLTHVAAATGARSEAIPSATSGPGGAAASSARCVAADAAVAEGRSARAPTSGRAGAVAADGAADDAWEAVDRWTLTA